MAAYEVRKQELVGKELQRLKEGTNTMNEILSSMNLPAGLEDTTGGGVGLAVVILAPLLRCPARWLRSPATW